MYKRQALVLETPTGNSLYGGLLTEAAAIKNFIRTCRFKPIPVRPDTTYQGVHFKRNRQTIAIPFKWTGKPQLKDWKKDILESLTNTISGQIGPIALYPTDRRLYLDIHPYETADGIYFSYALFSQFNCTSPIFSNFGNAIFGLKKDKEQLVNLLVNDIQKEVDDYLNRAENGFALLGLATSIPVDTSYQFGSKDSFNSITTTSDNSSISGKWRNVSASAFEQPLVQFNFPAPLNRYAGEIKKCNGQLTNEEGLLSGHFIVDLQSLTMGIAELDAKVLKQYIKVKANPTASFTFSKAPMVFNWETTSRQQIAGTFEFLNKKIPLNVEATITPNALDQSLSVQVSFQIEIAQTFGMPMPDGPKEAASQLDFLVNVKMQA